MESIIRNALEEDGVESSDGLVEKIAERLATANAVTGRPKALKRHETA